MLGLLFDTGATRSPSGLAGSAIKAFAAGTAAWTVYAAAFSRSDTLSLTITFLSLMLVLTPDDQRLKRTPLLHVKRSDSFGCVQFVGAE